MLKYIYVTFRYFCVIHNIYRTDYLDDCFSVLYKARYKKYLAFLEALTIP